MQDKHSDSNGNDKGIVGGARAGREGTVTVTDSTTPSLGLNELKRASRSLAFSLSQSMLQTANRRVVYTQKITH